MPQSDLSISMRTRLYQCGAAITALLALTGLLNEKPEGALVALLFSVLLIVNSFFEKQASWDKSPQKFLKQNFSTHVTTIFLVVATLLSAINSEYAAGPWSYILPMLLFFFYPLKTAIIVVSGYSLVLIILLAYVSVGPEKVELLTNYLLCLALTGGFVYLREIKDRQLKPLRRTDNLTQASTKEHLSDDLIKEIQRSEREGTDLTVMALAIDEKGFDQVDTADHDVLLNKLGYVLHENLRVFDSYYRWQDHEFLILFPYTNTQEAMKTAEKLRVKAKESLSDATMTITVSIGTASLNVGDNASSMLEKSLAALHHAQKSGQNRARSYIDSDTIDSDTIDSGIDSISSDIDAINSDINDK